MLSYFTKKVPLVLKNSATLKNHSKKLWRLQNHKNDFKLLLIHVQLHLRNKSALYKLDLGHE
jgi:hypothetical protein